MAKFLLRFPLHPLLFGAFPTLALMAANLQEAPLEDGLRALLVAGVLAIALFGLLDLVFKDWQIAGLLASLFLLSFYSYGHVYMGLKALGGMGLWFGRHRVLLPIWLALVGLFFWLAWKRLPHRQIPTSALNFIAMVLVLIPLFQISSFFVRNRLTPEAASVLGSASATTANPDDPDIYYILTDAYSRDDLLLKFYGYDNSEFLDQLKALGFYIAECSLSNYTKTRTSLSSSLNLDYLENLEISAENRNQDFFRRIQHNLVRKTLAAKGYKIVSMETGFYWTEWRDADLYLSASEDLNPFRANAFETLLLQTTLLRAPLDLFSGQGDQVQLEIIGGTPEQHYEITKHALDALDQLAFVEGPKFVFAHLVIPHDPFVFDAEGNFINEPRDPIQAHNAQLTYLNRRLIQSLTTIIEKSDRPVVIIVQGDHGGPGTEQSHDRMKILNAYYFPQGADRLYPSISPVNSFRLIFDTLFGTNYGLIPDQSYYSATWDFFHATLVTDDRPSCAPN